MVTTVAGRSIGFTDGTGTNAKFKFPKMVFYSTTGNLYVADSGNNKIRNILMNGVPTVSSVAGGGSTSLSTNAGYVDGVGNAAMFNSPTGITQDSNANIYVADYNNNLIRVISPTSK